MNYTASDLATLDVLGFSHPDDIADLAAAGWTVSQVRRLRTQQDKFDAERTGLSPEDRLLARVLDLALPDMSQWVQTRLDPERCLFYQQARLGRDAAAAIENCLALGRRDSEDFEFAFQILSVLLERGPRLAA